MTFQGWLNSRHPQEMLSYLNGKLSQRKQRLIACACCRLTWPLLEEGRGQDDRSLQAVAVTEAYVDALATEHQLIATINSARSAMLDMPHRGSFERSGAEACLQAGEGNVRLALINAATVLVLYGSADGPHEERQLRAEWEQAYLLRDIVGNPCHSTHGNSSWRTTTVNALTNQIYESRDFATMPILADGLEDAGCDNTDILSHLSGPGAHVRDCFALDLLLGKE